MPSRISPVRTMPLLDRLHAIIERTYDMRTGIRDVGRFVLGDDGYRRFYSSERILRTVESAGSPHGGARLLLRPAGDGQPLRAAIYYPDDLVRRLEASPPTAGLHERNIDDLADFTEELDHLLCVAHCVREERRVSLLELELHANVTKYLVGALFIGRARGRQALREGERLWLRYHLFEKAEFVEPDAEIRSRYVEARRYAARFLDRLDTMPTPDRIGALRGFHRSSLHGKLALLS